jgi:hypothetical protein
MYNERANKKGQHDEEALIGWKNQLNFCNIIK